MNTLVLRLSLALVMFAAATIGKIPTQTCDLETVQRAASHDGCMSEKVTVNACRGACLSVTESLVNAPWHKTTCKCCRQVGTAQVKSVTLQCNGGTTVTQTFSSATNCVCELC